jgi:hypothetical protein
MIGLGWPKRFLGEESNLRHPQNRFIFVDFGKELISSLLFNWAQRRGSVLRTYQATPPYLGFVADSERITNANFAILCSSDE